MVDQYGGQHFNPNSIPIFRHHFRPAFSKLLGQSSVLVRRTCWQNWRAGSMRNSRNRGPGSAHGDGENYQVRDILNPMSQHQHKSRERPNPSIRNICFLQLPRTLTSVVVWNFFLWWCRIWSGTHGMASAQNIVGEDGCPPPPTDLPHLSLADWGFVDDLRLVTQKLGAAISLHHWSV